MTHLAVIIRQYGGTDSRSAADGGLNFCLLSASLRLCEKKVVPPTAALLKETLREKNYAADGGLKSISRQGAESQSIL